MTASASNPGILPAKPESLIVGPETLVVPSAGGYKPEAGLEPATPGLQNLCSAS